MKNSTPRARTGSDTVKLVVNWCLSRFSSRARTGSKREGSQRLRALDGVLLARPHGEQPADFQLFPVKLDTRRDQAWG